MSSHRPGQARALGDLAKHGWSLCLMLLLMYAQHPTAFLPKMGYDICNMKYIFDLHPHVWHRVPKTLGVSCAERDKGVFCCVNEVTFRPAPKNGGWLPVGTFSPTSRPLGRGEGMEVEFYCQWPIIEASIKTQKDGVQRASGLVDTWRSGENGALPEGLDAPSSTPFPLTLRYASLPSGSS